jgi:hypothetical protein
MPECLRGGALSDGDGTDDLAATPTANVALL